MKNWLIVHIVAVQFVLGYLAYAQDAAAPPAPAPALSDPRLVATEAMLNQATAAHRDALAKMVELDRMVTDLQKQLAAAYAQIKVMSQSQAAPKGEPAK